jgi:hypothetical protein
MQSKAASGGSVMATKRIMIDCETMSLEDNPAIVQIAAVEFGPKAARRVFNRYIDPESAEEYGHVARETMEWWNGPERAEIRKKVFSGTALTHEAVTSFLAWCADICEGDWKNLKVYSKGGEDSLWVKNLCERLGHKWPFHYRAPQNMRTLQDVAELCELNLPEIPGYGSHDALEDCIWQVKVCEQIMNHLQSGMELGGGVSRLRDGGFV